MKVKLYGLLIILVAGIQVVLYAQPAVPPQNPPAPVPITGVEYLLLGGGIYGIYKFAKKRNTEKDA
jgi:hypothetical protein